MARTNIGGKFYIAVGSGGTTPDPQNADLSASAFGGLTYAQVPNMGQHGDTGIQQNLVSYSMWDKQLAEQQKGQATGAQAEVRFLDEDSDGMTAMKAAASVSDGNNYAFKIVFSDGSIEYNRGVVSAPTYPKGSNEDFAEAVFTIAFNQEPVFA